MHTLSQRQIDKKMDGDDHILLINVLPSSVFAMGHIPGSINIPQDSLDFVARVQGEMDDENQEVIVYCSGKDCPASTNAAARLEQAGLKHVLSFAGGLEEWKAAGHEIDTSAMEESEPDQMRALAREELAAAPAIRRPSQANTVRNMLKAAPQELKTGSSASQQAADPRDPDSKIRPH